MIADANNSGRQLFDLHKDPGERHSVAHQHPKVMREIYARVLHSAGAKRLPFFGN